MKAKLSLMVLWVSLGIAASQAATNQVVYFLVGFVPWRLEEFNSHDSFILPLTDSKDIAHARDLVRALNEYLQSSDPFKRFPPEGVDALQVAAFFAKGSDGINCNYLAPGKPLWSWHVTKLLGFFDYFVDFVPLGTPTELEQDLEGWIRKWEGWVDPWGKDSAWFAGYMVAEEIVPPVRLKAEVIQSGLGQRGGSPQMVILTWPALGENYAYTVEWATSLSAGDWAPWPGQTWPISETSVQVPVSSEARFFRLKIERTLAP
jgi:hypothetical protein